MTRKTSIAIALLVAVLGAIAIFGGFAGFGASDHSTITANNDIPGDSCEDLPDHAELTDALNGVVDEGGNRGDQWPGSRVISAQKANTANAFSLPDGSGGIPGLALSTANLYSLVQPGGTLFGLQESNPVDIGVAYGGDAHDYGQPNDPMIGNKAGGVNVFGGGLGLYNEEGELLGGLGLSGDTSCSDHIKAWKVRDALGLDHVPAGVSPTGDDNIIHDVRVHPPTGHTISEGGFGHPECDDTATEVANDLPETHPIGENP